MSSAGDGGPTGQAFNRLAAEDLDAPAVTVRDSTTSRQQLAARSSQLARRLGATGAGAGDTVTIAVPHGAGFHEGALAAWKRRAVPQAVSARLPGGELEAQVEVVDPAVLVGPDRAGGRPWVDTGEDMPLSGERPTYRYVGAPARARDGWGSPGDTGWFDPDGYLHLADRQTDMIRVGGATNVYPAEAEVALEEHPDVMSSCVISLLDEDYGNLVPSIVETSADVSDDGLRRFLADRLVSYELPRSVEPSVESRGGGAGTVRRGALRAARLADR